MKGFTPFFVASVISLGSLLIDHLSQAVISTGDLCWIATAILVAAWLSWNRRDELFQRTMVDEVRLVKERVQGAFVAVIAYGVIGVALVFFAQIAHWPYLGWLVFLYWIGLVFYAEFGRPGITAIGPVLILLIFLSPIPIPFAPWCSLALQSASTSLTMILLDFLKVFFFVEGNVLGLISQQQLYPELFQGVSWFAPTLFLVVAWGVHFQFRWIRTTINVCQAMGWVIVGNAVCTAVLLANKDWGGNWIEYPSMVVLWKCATLAGILFLIWSSDQFLASTVRPRVIDAPLLELETDRESRKLLPFRWILHRGQYALLFGLVIVFGLTLRLASNDRFAGKKNAAAMTGVQLPGEVSAWKVEPANAPETHAWLEPGGISRTWRLEREGRKLILELTASGVAPKPHVYPWLWSGWRLESPPKRIAMEEAGGEAVVAEFARLPGEVCTVIATGSDFYGHPSTANTPWESWGQMASVAQSNFCGVFGGLQTDSTSERVSLPASYRMSLSMLSTKALDTEKRDELLGLWSTIHPMIGKQFVLQKPR